MPATRRRHLLLIVLLLGIVPAASAFAWLWPDWLHTGHPLAAARARPAPHRSAAAASASEPPQPSSSGPDVCRPAHLEPPVNDQGKEQDWPELRSILGAIHAEAAATEPALVDKGPTVPGKVPPPPRRVRVDWWERALSPKLRTEYELYYGEGRAYSTIVNHVRTLKRLFTEAAPAIFVAGEHTFEGDHRPHPIVDTGGVATALPLTTKEQLRTFLHRYHDVLTATAEALPGRMGANALSALRHLTAYANDGTTAATRRRTAIIKTSEAAGPTLARRHPGLWGRLVSSTMQQQFADMQRFRNRSEEAVAATLETLPRLFDRLPLEAYEDAALAGPFGSTAELRRFLRRHYFDMLDVALERERAGKGGMVLAEEALAELWLFALLDCPDAIEWVGRWKRHLEEVDEAAAREADRMVVEWEMIAARALGEVEMAKERERVLGEMMAWARRVKEGSKQGRNGVGSVVGMQPALGAEEGGPGALDAVEEMVEAVGELQEGSMGKGFGRPPPNNNHDGGQPPEGKRGKRRYRRPWRRGQDRSNGGNGGT